MKEPSEIERACSDIEQYEPWQIIKQELKKEIKYQFNQLEDKFSSIDAGEVIDDRLIYLLRGKLYGLNYLLEFIKNHKI